MCIENLDKNAEHLKHYLFKITLRTYKWKVIILLDKMNMYLMKYSFQNIYCNNMILMFLCYLKYFQDIMFFIINQVIMFDQAFQNRIYFAMRFNKLNTKMKKKIWKIFLLFITRNIKNKKVDKLSHKNINNWQIKIASILKK